MSIGHASEYGTDDGQSYQDDNRSNGSQQPEKKMRRGRAAPPGRCHSCHRAETPEWRRGPDGARTLCNACGLHYAKLTRKLSKNPAGPGALAARKPPNSPLP
ncbi:GATA zinc finger-domain-containing protein [Trichophaea hybrida]|nr:GATA zinc finger-domain-containing protein [Trichophaea hybrida]